MNSSPSSNANDASFIKVFLEKSSNDKPIRPLNVEVILDNTILYNNITEIITREYVIMNEIQSY